MAKNTVTFDLELAVKDFNQNLKKVDSGLNSFHQDFKKQASTSSKAWGSFVGNLGAAAVSNAISGLVGLAGSMADFTVEAVKAAVDSQETASKFEAVFSTISDASAKTAKDLQKNYGLGVTESKELLSATGDLLTGFGFAQEGALELSSEVQKVAVDLASFTNFSGGAKGASEAITKALLGETESLKSLSVSINQKAVADQVLINNAKGITFETEKQAKAQATLDLILQQSGNALGDYARTSDGAANQLKLFNKRVEDLTIAFGENFIPIIEPVIKQINKFIEGLDQETINGFVKNGIVQLIEGFDFLVQAINPTVTAIKNIGAIFNIIQNGLTSGLVTISLAVTKFTQLIVQDFLNLVEALPDSLVPDGWKEGLQETNDALNETMDNMVESIAEDADDMAASMNTIMNPENVISEENIEIILSRTAVIKDGVLSAQQEIETDEIIKAKAKAARQKKQDAIDKKRQDGLNKESVKQTEFNEALFGKQTSFEESSGKERAANLKSTFATMATLSESGNSVLAGIGKAAAVSTATIDGIAAVQKALASAPPPLNFALAGVVGAATALNVAKIAGVNFETGGIVPGSSFTGDSVQANLNSGEMVLNRGQQAQLFQDLNNGGGSNNTDLISAINDLGDRISSMEIVVQADDTEIARSASRGVQNGIIIGESR